MEPISIEELALLEVLQRVDQSIPLQSGDTEIHQRLVDSGLVVVEDDLPRLTAAGVEMTKSLQHRVAADAQAAKIIQQRETNGADAGKAETAGRATGA
jgi:hypothetical protein